MNQPGVLQPRAARVDEGVRTSNRGFKAARDTLNKMLTKVGLPTSSTGFSAQYATQDEMADRINDLKVALNQHADLIDKYGPG